MKVLTGELRTIQQGLGEIAMVDNIPIKPSYWLARLYDKTNSELRALESGRMNLLKKYSVLDNEGNPKLKVDKDGNSLGEYDLTAENKIKFEKDYAELMKIEVDLTYNTIKIKALGTLAKVKPIVLFKLKKIIVE